MSIILQLDDNKTSHNRLSKHWFYQLQGKLMTVYSEPRNKWDESVLVLSHPVSNKKLLSIVNVFRQDTNLSVYIIPFDTQRCVLFFSLDFQWSCQECLSSCANSLTSPSSSPSSSLIIHFLFSRLFPYVGLALTYAFFFSSILFFFFQKKHVSDEP